MVIKMVVLMMMWMLLLMMVMRLDIRIIMIKGNLINICINSNSCIITNINSSIIISINRHKTRHPACHGFVAFHEVPKPRREWARANVGVYNLYT